MNILGLLTGLTEFDDNELELHYRSFAGPHQTYKVSRQGSVLLAATDVSSGTGTWVMERREVARFVRFCIWDWWIKREWFGVRRPLHDQCVGIACTRSMTARQLNRTGGDR